MFKKFTATLFLLVVMFSITTGKTYATFFFTASDVSFNPTTGHLSFDISDLPGFYNYETLLTEYKLLTKMEQRLTGIVQ